MAKYLVTGGAGFLGSHVIRALLKGGNRVVAADIIAPKSANRLENVMDRIEYRWQSVVDLTADSLKGTDYVLHFAALTDVPLANTSLRYTFQLNLDATLSLLLAAKAANTPVLAMSTENVYGSLPPERLPAVEDEPLLPRNSYAASKVAAEVLARAYSFQFGLPVSFIRSSTLFGPMMRTGEVVSIFSHQALMNEPITIEGDGSQTRDFNYVDNMVNAIMHVVERPREGFNVWNIGSGTEWTLLQLVREILQLSGSKSRIVHRGWRPGEEGRLSVSIEKAKRELGYEPSVSVQEGLRRLISWMKA